MLLDTDVVIDIFRGFPPAVTWVTNYSGTIEIPGLVAMELLQGCPNKANQLQVEAALKQFAFRWPTAMDCQLAYQLLVQYRLSHGIGLIDCLIAATAIGLGQPLATFNLKHYSLIASLQTIQPN